MANYIKQTTSQRASSIVAKFLLSSYFPLRFLKESKRIMEKGKLITQRMRTHKEIKRNFLRDFDAQWKDTIYRLRVKEVNFNLRLLGEDQIPYEYVEGLADYMFEEKLIQIMKKKPWVINKSQTIITDVKENSSDPIFDIKFLEKHHKIPKTSFNFDIVVSGINWKIKKIKEENGKLEKRKSIAPGLKKDSGMRKNSVSKKEKSLISENKTLSKFAKRRNKNNTKKYKTEKNKKKTKEKTNWKIRLNTAEKPRGSVQQKLVAIKSFGVLVNGVEKLEFQPEPIELEALVLLSVDYVKRMKELNKYN